MSNDNPNNPPPNQNGNQNRQNPSSKDSSNNTPQKTNETNQDPSLLNRIQASATGLLRDTLTNPNAHALGSDFGLLGGAANGKASSSSSSSRWTGWVNGSQYYDSAAVAGASTSSRESGVAYGAAEGFRSTQENHTQFSLEEFNNQPADFYQHDYGDEYNNTLQKGKGKGKASISFSPSIPTDTLYTSDEEYYEAAWIRHTAAAQQHQPHDTQPAQTTQTKTLTDQDGAAVVSLLSDPSFQPSFFADDDSNDFYDEAGPDPLTADEIRILESFRRQQQSSTTSPPHNRPNTITPHSLIPDIDTFLAENDNLSLGGTTSDAALRDAVLHNMPGAEDWMAVNDRYQDEVWGYLRPALEAASKEIEESNEREKGPAREGPAVRRLKMILRHMQS